MALGTLKGIVLTSALVGSSIAGTATVLKWTGDEKLKQMQLAMEQAKQEVVKANQKLKTVFDKFTTLKTEADKKLNDANTTIEDKLEYINWLDTELTAIEDAIKGFETTFEEKDQIIEELKQLKDLDQTKKNELQKQIENLRKNLDAKGILTKEQEERIKKLNDLLQKKQDQITTDDIDKVTQIMEEIDKEQKIDLLMKPEDKKEIDSLFEKVKKDTKDITSQKELEEKITKIVGNDKTGDVTALMKEITDESLKEPTDLLEKIRGLLEKDGTSGQDKNSIKQIKNEITTLRQSLAEANVNTEAAANEIAHKLQEVLDNVQQAIQENEVKDLDPSLPEIIDNENKSKRRQGPPNQ
ncbi:hypothetical protein [Bacillus cytotoxicus]|uniref:hypothetical protein n=5 Tax=Bacillus cytotoxicus TaxID=580165 RepID=UPI000B97917A|nr:hypothetical protein [Bacillus cytotoxicus]AWC30424.1 hypothetical protein CG483_020230 [Bacillus cytotoxicus]AWC42564.1 hypothetical protein CG480_020250 [Bacillus cytotoxicus]AWC50495.1 hypothetical protein CG478_020250 [Bacillus cytotoxicus]AWC54551.1 hypothetical protein CG477_020435 [Bacillus cytotoxicus]AWC58674.1 hypothetical protein CG476_020455 [Bacillus cytotoxicus]